MKILCFGSCNIDMVYAVDHILCPGETMSADGLELFPGGKGLNQAIAVARAGAPVYFAGCIGEDGQFLKDTLTACGVDIRYLRQVAEKTGHAIIQVDKAAENAILIYSGANGMVTAEQIDSVLADFAAGDILLVQNEISNLSYLVESASGKGMQVVFNPSPFNAQAQQVDLSRIRYLLVNQTEARCLTGSETPEALQAYIRDNNLDLRVILTRGKEGSAYIDRDAIHYQSAFPVRSVDTTGAGDTYTGYLIAMLSEGKDYKTAMRYASAASAISVSQKGAASSIPLMEKVEEYLKGEKANG